MESIDATKRKLDDCDENQEEEGEENENNNCLNKSEIVVSKKLNSKQYHQQPHLPRSNSDLSSSNKSKDEYLTKIRKIIETNFDEEINYKQYELEKINDRIFEAQNCLDKLRVCIICRYYSLNGRLNLNDYINHPAIANLNVEDLDLAIEQAKLMENSKQTPSTSLLSNNMELQALKTEEILSKNDLSSTIAQLSKIRIFVGNVSKSLNTNNSTQLKQKASQINSINEDESISCSIKSSQYNQDLITHKWMVYIRSPNCSRLDSYIKKVVFYLHFSYKPYDVVEVKSPPFQLTKKGWGEFPIHVQIHFKDPRNKRVDINHQIKLDWTQTGLQTFGGETSKDVELIIKKNDLINSLDDEEKIEESPIGLISKPKTSLDCATTSFNAGSINEINQKNSLIETKETLINMNEQSQDNSVDLKMLNKDESSNASIIRSFSTEDSLSNSSSQFSSYSNFNKHSSNKHLPNLDNFKSNLSPSNFISTEIDPTNNAASIKSNRRRLDTNSFDELMMNFCSNEKNIKEGEDEDEEETDDIENNSNDNKKISLNEEKKCETSKNIQNNQNKATIDELLNIRPIQIQSPKLINTLVASSVNSITTTTKNNALSLIKGLKPVNITSNNSNNNTMINQKIPVILNTNSNIQQTVIPKINQSNNISAATSATASTLINNSNNKTNLIIKNTNEKINSSQSQITSIKSHNQIISSNINKKMVIYKVESSDLKKEISSETNKAHLPATLQQFKLIHQQKREHSNTITKTNENNLNQTSRITLSNSNVNLENQSNLNRNINILNSLIQTNTDPFKTTIKSDRIQLNETKLREQENTSLNLVENSEMKLNKSNAENEQNNTTKNESFNLANEHLKLNSEQSNEETKTKSTFIYSLDYINDLVQKQNENRLEISSFESYLKRALKYYPIISNSTRQNKLTLPFCARSIHEYYSWPYAKRKASEWIRAVHLKRKCKQLIELSNNSNDINIEIWSTKSIVLWLRSHGYSPLEYKHMLLNETGINRFESIFKSNDFGYVNSFSSLNDLNLFKNFNLNNIYDEENDEIIDVISDNSLINSKKADKKVDIKNLNEEEFDQNGYNNLEISEECKHIKEQLELINLKTSKVNLVPSNENPNETNKYGCNLVEKMLVTIYKRFAEDLIRETCANIYFDSSKNIKNNSIPGKKQTKNESNKKEQLPQLAQNQQQDGLDYQKFPQHLSVSDIFNTIHKDKKYDFLTNKNMAKLDKV